MEDPTDREGPSGWIDGRVVLDDDGLDLLELVLAGAAPAAALGSLVGAALPGDGEIELLDGENTPVARVRVQARTRSGPTVQPLQPLPSGTGPAWDEVLRRPPGEIRGVLVQPGRARVTGDVLAVVLDDAPTVGDLATLEREVLRAQDRSILWVVPASRRPKPPGMVGWGGLARIARTLAGEGPIGSIPLVVPWPSGQARTGQVSPAREAADLDLGTVLAAYGASRTLRVTSVRSTDDAARVMGLPRAWEQAVRSLYPPVAAEEVVRAGDGGRARHGAVVFFTGLSGAGKSTIARALADSLRDDGRQVTLLDGDDVRRNLTADLGFDAESRERNVERVAYVASLIALHGGTAIAALIAPFATGRRRARQLVAPHGAFLLVYVAAPLEVAEARDRKGLYARARVGELEEFTGVSSPYEEPDDADVTIDTATTPVAEAVAVIRRALEGPRRERDEQREADRRSD